MQVLGEGSVGVTHIPRPPLTTPSDTMATIVSQGTSPVPGEAQTASSLHPADRFRLSEAHSTDPNSPHSTLQDSLGDRVSHFLSSLRIKDEL